MKSKTKKLIWSAPLVAVLAVAGALAIFMTQAPNEASAQQMDLPGMVQDVQVTAYADGVPEEQLEVTWSAPTDGGSVDNYRIDISMDGDRWMSHVPNHRDSELRLVYSGIESEQMRHFRVFAVNRYGTGPGSDDSGTTDKSVKPDRPENLDADPAGETIALDLNGDGDATDTNVDNVDETQFGIDLNGDGDATDTDLDGVDETSITANAQTVIVLDWDAPDEAPPGAPITGYKIQYSDNGLAPWRDLADDVMATSYAHGDLRAQTLRHYRVYAQNKYGLSTVSDSDSATTGDSTPPGVPTVPVIGLSPRGYDVHLSWTAPVDPAGDPVIHYIVQARDGDSEEADDYANVHSGTSIDRTTMYNFGGRDIDNKGGIDLPASNLIPAGGVSVDIRIGALNNTNRSDDPEWLELGDVPVGHEGAPKKPETPRARPDVTTATTYEGRSGLNVTWNTAEFIDAGNPGLASDPENFSETDFNSAVSYFLVVDGEEQDTDIDHAVALAAGGNVARPGYDDDSLETETEKTYYVYALNSAVTVTGASVRSFPSRSGMGKTARPLRPDAPTGLDVQDSGHTEIDVSWTHASDEDAEDACAPDAGSDADGSECGVSVITSYKIEISETGTSGWNVLVAEQSASPYTAVDLKPGARYFFRVSAMNSRYTSDPTPAISAITTDPGAPTPPGGLVAQADGRHSIKLCWYEQNVVIGGADMDEALPVLGYKITRQAAGGSVETVMENTGNDKTEYTDMRLMAGTAYTYSVHSITLGGTSPSAAAMTTTDLAVVPGMPAGVTAMPTSDTEITVSWGAPADNGGAAITGYMVERGVMGTDSMMTWTDVDPAHTGTAMMYMDMSLMPMTTYYYRVSAMNSAGTGAMPDGMDMAMTYRTNTAPTADGTIADMTLKAGQMSSGMDVTSYFSDADMDDTLTYTARSNMPMYATVAVSGNMVTATGVAAGTATITVTATDMGVGAGMMNPMTATQTFMVTVEAAPAPMLTAPTMVDATVSGNSVTVTWVDGENAARHAIILFTSDYEVGGRVISDPSDNSVPFSNLTAGNYIAVVVALDSAGDDFQDMAIGFDLATVPGS